jgi:hypothetical protein
LVAFSFVILCVMRRMLSSQKAMKRRNNEAQLADMFGQSAADHMTAGKGAPQYPELKYETNVSQETEDMSPLHNELSRDEHMGIGGGGVGDVSFVSVGNDSSDPLNPTGGSQSPTRDYYRGVQMYPTSREDASTQSPRRGRKPKGAVATVPAGTYLPDAEDGSQGNNFGPGVVPIPKLRNRAAPPSSVAPAYSGYNNDQASYVAQRVAEGSSNYGDSYNQGGYSSGTNYDAVNAEAIAVGTGPVGYDTVRADYSNYGGNYAGVPTPPAHGVASAPAADPSSRPSVNYRRPSGPRALTAEITEPAAVAGADEPYIAPRQRWQRDNRDPVGDFQGEPVARSSPAQSQRRQYVDTVPQPQAAEHYYDDNTQMQPPPGNSYDYQPHSMDMYSERPPHNPSSPAASDSSSHYTSISQRGPNPQYHQAPAQQTRSDFVLQTNPDFAVAASSKRNNPTGGQRRTNGNKARPPAASEVSDSPFAISRTMQ